MQSNRRALLVIFLIMFVDILGFTIVLPLLPFYAEAFGASPFQVGMLVSVYAFCQFLSGPVMGRLSDRFGRKRILMLSQLGTLAGFIMLAMANALWVVFLARIIDGLTAGNLTVAQAYLSDVTEPKDRAKAFGIIGIAFGLGFFIGPALSGVLATTGTTFPPWAAAGFSLLSIICSQTLLPTVDPRQTLKASTGQKFKIFDLQVLVRSLRNANLRTWLILYFLFNLSFSAIMSGFALFAERRLTWDSHPFGAREVGYVYTYLGLIGIIVQGGLIGRLVKKFGEQKVALVGFLLQGIGYGLYSLINSIPVLLIAATIGSLGAGVVRPSSMAMLSHKSPRDEQGSILGVAQSLASIAMIIAPLVSGLLINFGQNAGWALWGGAPALVGFVVMMMLPNQRTTDVPAAAKVL